MSDQGVNSGGVSVAEEGGYVCMPKGDFDALCAEQDLLLVWAAVHALVPPRYTVSTFMGYRGRPDWTWEEYEDIVRGWAERGRALVEGK